MARDADLVVKLSACIGIAALSSGSVKTRSEEKACSVDRLQLGH
jgi:hypothetical protein